MQEVSLFEMGEIHAGKLILFLNPQEVINFQREWKKSLIDLHTNILMIASAKSHRNLSD